MTDAELVEILRIGEGASLNYSADRIEALNVELAEARATIVRLLSERAQTYFEMRARAESAEARLRAVEETTLAGINLRVIREAYDWELSSDGEVCGLTAGDQYYEPTGIKLGVTVRPLPAPPTPADQEPADATGDGTGEP